MNEKIFGLARILIGSFSICLFVWFFLTVYSLNAYWMDLTSIGFLILFFVIASMSAIMCLGDGIIMLKAAWGETMKIDKEFIFFLSFLFGTSCFILAMIVAGIFIIFKLESVTEIGQFFVGLGLICYIPFLFNLLWSAYKQ